MSDRLVLSLWEPVQAKQAFNAAWERAKALTLIQELEARKHG